MAVATTHRATGHVRWLTFDVVAEVDGSVPATPLPQLEGYLLAIVTAPGSPAPTEDYDVIVVTDRHGHDVLEGMGANRSTRAIQRTLIRQRRLHPCVAETDELTFVVRGNLVSRAALTVVVLYGSGTGRVTNGNDRMRRRGGGYTGQIRGRALCG